MKPKKTVHAGLVLAVFTVATSSLAPARAQAQEVPSYSPTPPRAAPVAPVIPAKLDPQTMPQITPGEVIGVELNKAVAIKVTTPVRNVILADPNIADVIIPGQGVRGAPKRHFVYVVARKIGSTSVMFEDAKGEIILKSEIRVHLDTASLKSAFKDLLPEEKIEVSAHGDSLFLKGFVRSPGVSAKALEIAKRYVPKSLNVVNMLQILGSQQVIMRVRISELQREAVKHLGVNLSVSNQLLRGAVSLATVGATDLSAANFISNPPFGTGSIGLPYKSSAAFSALERQGVIKTLAEPTLTAISGENANFLSGGEFPFPVGLDTNGLPIIKFKEFGIRLDATPTVISKNRINLILSTEVSQLSTDGQVKIGTLTVNSISTRRTQTTVDLPSGGSVMIAGLMKNNESNKIRGLPFLKDLPILGQLFRSESFQRDQTELVIIVTAYLAKSTGNDKPLNLPTDGFASASDMDVYLLGRLNKEYLKKDLPPYVTPLSGPYGYIME
ncbi:type II and III secretion system protein family protein [Varunaivibrio sulfuroxidans]|uniref:Pilus assembly protein CpaC n=1 Tax=Varunaivibrio sulfuroxidans TaxID=1773489 RepID=A0A4V2UP02_9PROT|nr:type II and III secretion system protein family protein [Varunaivibrio sulfuroxidans]TCS64031.1 pilus assembly protein CpaC [Varunaivibrio sulfuroxidans]WES31516.1 type II and III secretion system protein family protein [Varunaivibrio sulfuroxidans]